MKVLELENQLTHERVRLGELRRKHYEMGGIALNSTSGSAVNDFDSSLPTDFPDPPRMELPSLEQYGPDSTRLEPLKLNPLQLEPVRLEPPAPEPVKNTNSKLTFFHKFRKPPQ